MQRIGKFGAGRPFTMLDELVDAMIIAQGLVETGWWKLAAHPRSSD